MLLVTSLNDTEIRKLRECHPAPCGPTFCISTDPKLGVEFCCHGSCKNRILLHSVKGGRPLSLQLPTFTPLRDSCVTPLHGFTTTYWSNHPNYCQGFHSVEQFCRNSNVFLCVLVFWWARVWGHFGYAVRTGNHTSHLLVPLTEHHSFSGLHPQNCPEELSTVCRAQVLCPAVC